MTAAELRDVLKTLLENELGTYTTAGGTELAAIRLGEPPSDYVASGLECRISVMPDITQIPAYGRGALDESHRVRLVMHNGDEATQLKALRRISSRWPDVSFSEIPANEQMGILAQHVVTIPA